jgi:hypothetical protein
MTHQRNHHARIFRAAASGQLSQINNRLPYNVAFFRQRRETRRAAFGQHLPFGRSA